MLSVVWVSLKSSCQTALVNRDGNGYPPPVYPRVKTLLGCGFGEFCPHGCVDG
jgi:hypothetical protein